MPTSASATPSLRKRFKRAYKRPMKLLGQSVERWVANQSPIGDSALVEKAHFDWVGRLEENTEVVKRELETILKDRARVPNIQDLSPTQRNLTLDDGWKSYFFYAFGRRIDESCVRCPETARLLDSIPDLSLAFFSILAPGKHIPAHRGGYKGVVRCHLGLIVPEPRSDVRMRVGDEMIHWDEGRCIMFDDTYRHEVWNETDGVRVVLLIDVCRPFPGWLTAVNRFIIRLIGLSPEVRRVVRMQRESEMQLAAGQ